MANFVITIGADLAPPYSQDIVIIDYDNCSPPVTNTYSIALLEGTPSSTKINLLSSYTGIALKTLHIDNIVYSDDAVMWIEYNGIKLTGSGNTIDLTGLSSTDIIPLLEIEFSTSLASNNYIKFDISITDTDDIQWSSVYSQVFINVSECPSPTEPAFNGTIDTVAGLDCANGETKVFEIIADPYTNIVFRWTTISVGNHGFDGTFVETDTKDGTEINYLSAIHSAVTSPKDILVFMGSDTNKFFRVCIEARPSFGPGTNDVSGSLALRNNANDGDIGSITLSDSEI